jgi:hypothetical protein
MIQKTFRSPVGRPALFPAQLRHGFRRFCGFCGCGQDPMAEGPGSQTFFVWGTGWIWSTGWSTGLYLLDSVRFC